MAKLDIRNIEDNYIDEILFSDAENYVSRFKWDGGSSITMENGDGDADYEIYLEDIDNLILALKKAKDLWASN